MRREKKKRKVINRKNVSEYLSPVNAVVRVTSQAELLKHP